MRFFTEKTAGWPNSRQCLAGRSPPAHWRGANPSKLRRRVPVALEFPVAHSRRPMNLMGHPPKGAGGMKPPCFDGLANRFQWATVSTRMRSLLFGVCNPW